MTTEEALVSAKKALFRSGGKKNVDQPMFEKEVLMVFQYYASIGEPLN